MSRPFFRSMKYPHLTMNRYGIVFAPNGHPDGVDYFGRSFPDVPLHRGLLPLRYEVEEEARQAGYTKQYIGNAEVLWRRPATKEVPV